ncbi:MAG: hypothetical protein KAJ20_02280 [Candidatus Aenigmarchaeota archaeon]|nr:hypothetical protein [Candidatus Aenigmarchaeota archaeon]MCK5062629.1 hypothetical protein [Candidatus Aenigmarchaeota archaeon]MCK5234604.1 hypothetical protein [Candidatus Aenigmarchaeota archaeon]MCK5289304.1 hypothetical protein [Candidatus Aenigmarchaeota archaeon]MCK5373138.1 hypothetical protein [Candidatus Aenigmarchaeota archaeon]
MGKFFYGRKAQVQIVSMILLTGITIAAVSGALWWGLPMLDKSKSNSEITQAVSIMQEIKKATDEVSMSGGSRMVNINLKGEMVIEGASMEKQADGSIKVIVPPDRKNSVTYTIITSGVASATGLWIPLDGFNPISQGMYSGGNGDDVVLPPSNTCTISNLCPGPSVVDLACTEGPNVGSVGEGYILNSEYKIEYIDCTAGSEYVTIVGPEKPVIGFSGINNAGVIVVKTVPHGDEYKVMFKLVYRELDDLDDVNGKGNLVQITKKGNTLAGASDSSTHKTSITIAGLDRFVEGTAEKTGGPLTVTPVTMSFGS